VSDDELGGIEKTPARTAVTWALVIAIVVGSMAILKTFSMMREGKKKPEATGTPRAVVTVEVAAASWRSLPDVVVVSGTVSAVDPLSVGSEVNGLRVEQVLAEEGDHVIKGQTLAVLNRSLLEAQLSQAQARLRSAQAQVSRAIQPNRPQEISALQAALAQAQAGATQEQANLKQAQVTFSNAEQTAQRYQKVLGEGFVTLQEASDRQAELDRQRQLVNLAQRRVQAADFAVEQARQRLLLAQAGGRHEDVAVAQATTQEISGLIRQIEAQLDQTIIRAPDQGTLLKRDVHLGEISSAGKSMFLLARRGELELRADVPQAQFLKLREGLRAQVTCAGKKSGGRIWKLSPEVDAESRLGSARILLDSKSAFRVGMFGEARLEVGEHRALTVPSEAIQGEAGEYFVYKLEGTTALRQRVSIGVRTDKTAEILDGLKPDQSVVTLGARFLSDGDRVRIKE